MTLYSFNLTCSVLARRRGDGQLKKNRICFPHLVGSYFLCESSFFISKFWVTNRSVNYYSLLERYVMFKAADRQSQTFRQGVLPLSSNNLRNLIFVTYSGITLNWFITITMQIWISTTGFGLWLIRHQTSTEMKTIKFLQTYLLNIPVEITSFSHWSELAGTTESFYKYWVHGLNQL